MSAEAPFNILLSIDDDPSMLKLVKQVFAQDFKRILTSEDPREGLRLAMIYKPDLILLDNDMPGLSGLEILAQLRDMPGTQEIPVFMQTGNSQEETVYAALKHQIAGYLLKPLEPEVLHQQITAFLYKRQHKQPPQAQTNTKKIELTTAVALAPQQIQLLDLHSALNILTVIANETHILYLQDQQPAELEPVREQVKLLKSVLMDDQAAAKQQEQTLKEIGQKILSTVTHYLQQRQTSPQELDLDLFERNLNSLLKLLELRYQELAQRQQDPLKWSYLNAKTLRSNLQHVFEAIELNSHGRYHIVYQAQDKQPGDYLIEIIISAPQREGRLYMPLVLQDIMRDLTANARKYSAPGSVVRTRLEDDGHCIHLTISDQGMGIPEDELQTIVNFGYRARNAQAKQTMGGGFGLTKAWYFTQKMGGRMWISSELHKGTDIQLEIPYPPGAAEASNN